MRNTETRILVLIGAAALALDLLLLWRGAVQPVQADPGTPAASTRYVALQGDDSGNDCADSGHPCATIQRAVDAADPDDAIHIAGGTYAPGGTVAVIEKGLVLQGGHAPDFSGHDPGMYQTVLDAGWSGSVISVTNAGGGVALEFLTLTHGDGAGNCSSGGCGGGVYSTDTELYVSHCHVTDNVGSSTGIGKGGGLYVYNSIGHPASAHIHNNQIVSNTASTADKGRGGGLFLHVHNAAAPAEVVGNRFENNVGSTAGDGYGGGVFLHYYATFHCNHFQHNIGGKGSGLAGGGGGLYLHYAPGVTLDANRFLYNAASMPDGGPGRTIFGRGTGGAIQAYSLVVFTMTNNLLADNFATSAGGAIHLDGWTADRGITGTLVNNTLAGNESQAGSEAVWVSQYVSLTLTNNIIAAHTTGVTNTVPVLSSVSAERNLFWNTCDPIVGVDAIQEDPRLTPNYHLRVGSPAVDQGLDVPWLTSDLDGNPRSPGSYDLGALEGQEVWYDVYLPLVVKQYPLAMTSVFSADFEDGTLTGWTSSQGTWTNPGDHMRGEHTGSAWNMHTSSGDNIVYTGTVTLVSGDAAGLVFRSSTDGSSSYDVTLDASDDAFKVGRRAPYQVLGSYPVTVQYNRPYEIKVVASGSTIEAYLDGWRILTVTDTTYTSGRLGVMVYQSTATYDDLAAWEIP